MLLTVIPASLAGTAVLAFFWTLVLRINDLERRLASTNARVDQQAVDPALLIDLSQKIEEHALRHGRAIESATAMMGAMRAEMNDQQERVSALIDLRLTRAADEMSFDLRRVQLAYADLKAMMVVTPAAVDAAPDVKPAAQEAAAASAA